MWSLHFWLEEEQSLFLVHLSLESHNLSQRIPRNPPFGSQLHAQSEYFEYLLSLLRLVIAQVIHLPMFDVQEGSNVLREAAKPAHEACSKKMQGHTLRIVERMRPCESLQTPLEPSLFVENSPPRLLHRLAVESFQESLVLNSF